MFALPHYLANRSEIELLVAEFDLTTERVTRPAPFSLDRDAIIAEIRKERQQNLLQTYHKYSRRSPGHLKDICALDIAEVGSLF